MRYKYIVFLLFIDIFFLNSQGIKVSVIGDIMAHDNVQYYALATAKGYETLFESTKDIFLNDDLTIGNLETPVCDEIGVKNFPRFCAKTSFVTAIKKSGIEILSLANNHSYDQKEKGITSTLEAVTREGIIHSGIGLTPNEARKPRIFNYKGIIFGFLSATFSVNSIPMSEKEDKPYVNLVYMENYQNKFDLFCKTINETKNRVDFMIVSYHSGTEYMSVPSDIQSECLRKIAESGADIVLGHHPHVLQKVEYYRTQDKRDVLIAYSLGNFISGQSRKLNSFEKGNKEVYEDNFSKTAEGIILQFYINRWNNKFYVSNPLVIPLFNMRYNTKIENVNYQAFNTLLINDINKLNENNCDIENIDVIKDLVAYRFEKMKKLINIKFL